VTFKIILL